MDDPIRTFVALELSRSQKDGILSLTEALKRRGIRASWSRSATLHLTLRFLGDVEASRIGDVVEAARAAISGVEPFVFATAGLGAFPSPRRPRVIWLGVEPSPELFELQSGLERELERVGFPRERRPFKPHLTVGRVRNPGDAAGLPDVLAALDAPHEETIVRDVRVMRSTLARGGAVHEVLERLPLVASSD